MSGSVAAAAVDALGAAFLAGDPDEVLGHFVTDGEPVYAGSEPDEVAVGRDALRALLAGLFSRDERYTWRTTRVASTRAGDGLCLVADAVLSVHPHCDGVTAREPAEQVPYRISGVLERETAHWRWRMCQGSEPVQP